MSRKNDEISDEARKIIFQLTEDFKRAIEIIRKRLPIIIEEEEKKLSGSRGQT